MDGKYVIFAIVSLWLMHSMHLCSTDSAQMCASHCQRAANNNFTCVTLTHSVTSKLCAELPGLCLLLKKKK